jgi:hypothetical protein
MGKHLHSGSATTSIAIFLTGYTDTNSENPSSTTKIALFPFPLRNREPTKSTKTLPRAL